MPKPIEWVATHDGTIIGTGGHLHPGGLSVRAENLGSKENPCPATKGGPGTRTESISIFAYVKGFQQFETSYTAAVALLIIVLLSVVVFAALKRVELAR